MNANEIYEFLFNSLWKSGFIKDECTVKFIQKGMDGFDIVITQGERILSRHHFDKSHFQIYRPETDTFHNTYLTYDGPNHYISIISDSRVLVHLPDLKDLMLRKLEFKK